MEASGTSCWITRCTRGWPGSGLTTVASSVADDDRGGPTSDPLETSLRRRLRIISFGTFLVLLVVIVLADQFGRAAGLHANEFVFGALLGSVLLILGVEGIGRVIGR